MKKYLKYLMASAIAIFSPFVANAQFYEIANQLPGLIRPAIVGGFNYKGFVDVDYVKGIGNHNVDFLGVSTSQGFKYSSWFFMGVGIGVDVVFSHPSDDFGDWDSPSSDYVNHGSTTTGVMIPLFTDFRFNLGNQSKASFFIDLKLGCSFLIGKDYLQVDNGYLTSQQYFLLRPTLGVRIPVNSANDKQAFNIGLTYQLLTSNYWSSWSRNVTLNGLGINASFEW